MSLQRRLIYMMAALSLTTACSAPGAMAQDKPKGLFFEQLSKPKESINTGLRYWIELVRNGQMTRVTNKHQFASGDRIRFHIRSNIDGYAYILLSSGSRGEQSVLFGDPKSGDDNHVERGREYELPSDGYLKFDDNPGQEKLTLLLSRSQMDAQAFLNKPTEQPAVIASAMIGSKDLVPSKIVIAYNPVHKAEPVAPPVKVEKKADPAPTTPSSSKPAKVVGKAKTVKKKDKIAAASSSSSQPGPAQPGTTSISAERQPVSFNANDPGNEDGVVTVVKKDPSGVLYVDVTLDHK
jgi:hypothetical protein